MSGYLPFRNARNLAVYWATTDEVATAAIMEYANSLGKAVYLPIINTASWRAETMYFHRYMPRETVLTPNRFGILEPIQHNSTQQQYITMLTV